MKLRKNILPKPIFCKRLQCGATSDLSEQFYSYHYPGPPQTTLYLALVLSQITMPLFNMFLTYGNCHFYSTVCTALLIVYFLHTWKKKIWPEIRVAPKSPDDDDWTPVHPRLLSMPELCKHLAATWCYTTRCIRWWTSLRRNRPFKFFIESSFIFTCGAIVGHYISGMMLSYMIIMSMVLWPCLQYHSLLKKFYMKFEPIFMKLDYSIKVKNKWRYKERAAVTTNENTDNDGKRATSVCADNESDLEDFYPSDPTISAALARAITDSEDEGGTPASLTPGLSKEPSEVNIDDEPYKEEEIENDFGLSIDQMPSFEDTLDHTDDELLDEPSLPQERQSRESSEEGIRFIPSHFEDDEDTETFTLQPQHLSSLARWSTEGGGDNATQAMAEQLVTQTLTSVMRSAIENSVMGALKSMSGAAAAQDPRLVQTPGDRIASTYSDSDEDVTDSVDDHGRADARKNRIPSEDSSSLNIEEDFEFLDEYDLESSTEKGVEP